MEGSFFMSKIIELIDDFRLNQQIEGRKPEYIDLCTYRLNRWYTYMNREFAIEDVEVVKPIHIKRYIQECQQLGVEKPITINGSLSTLRVFFQYLITEEYLGEFDDPMRKIRNLKEEKRVIITFNDDEVEHLHDNQKKCIEEYSYNPMLIP